MYPAIEAHENGMLDVGEGNHLYWEVCGSSAGKPAVVLHGGPGSGCSPAMRRFFDPSAYRIVLFDQRGAGRSTPHASDPAVDLATNTTEHLLRDIERLRAHLGIERWLVFGVSWGSTLGLAYAERHPDRVSEIVLAGVGTSRRSEIAWLYRDVGVFFPEEHERFLAGVPAVERDDPVAAYHRLLEDPDPVVRAEAARAFSEWEWVTSSVDDGKPPARWLDPTFQLGRARIFTHHFASGAFLEDGALLRGAPALAGIPGVLINGRLDVQCPLRNAWELARVWPDAELVIVERAGHSTGDAGMADVIVAATDRFAG